MIAIHSAKRKALYATGAYVIDSIAVSPGKVGDITPNKQYDNDIVKLLHSLHGGDVVAVGKRRRCLNKLIREGELNAWELGFVIHAFGDSYSHNKDDNTAYGPTIGHLWGGHSTDIIGLHYNRWRIYTMSLANAIASRKGLPAPDFNSPAWKDFFSWAEGNLPGENRHFDEGIFYQLAKNEGSRVGFALTYRPGHKFNTDPKMTLPGRNDVEGLLDKIREACCE